MPIYASEGIEARFRFHDTLRILGLAYRLWSQV